jgi:hypothetical protein
LLWSVYNHSFDEEFANCSSGEKGIVNIMNPIRPKYGDIDLLRDYYLEIILFVWFFVPGDDNFDDWKQAINFNIMSHDITETGFEYTLFGHRKHFKIKMV